ncbi:unnamed protein product [Linum trigynum]|uniref:Uncharacterized protein n=1 Tax=Linum trigynum TaxID=586398 RepID=A0AAV2G5X9_9ROSI
MVEKACAQLTQEQLLTICEEEEEEKANPNDDLEQKVVTKSHCDTRDLECPFEVAIIPHFTLNFKEIVTSEEMRADPIKDIAWKLDIQHMLEEE